MSLTFGMIKPDCIKKDLTGKVINRILQQDFEILKMEKIKMDEIEAKRFYKEHKKKEFFPDLINFITSGCCIPMVLSAENAVEKFRELIGDTDPQKAKENTIRSKYANSVQNNIIHGADSEEKAKREMNFFYPIGSIVKIK